MSSPTASLCVVVTFGHASCGFCYIVFEMEVVRVVVILLQAVAINREFEQMAIGRLQFKAPLGFEL